VSRKYPVSIHLLVERESSEIEVKVSGDFHPGRSARTGGPPDTRQREGDNTVIETDYDALEEGGHLCPGSPSARCIYDSSNDPAHDSCLFCGEPSERK
jgi:hypothetical protein